MGKKKRRTSKTSMGTARGSKPIKLTPIQLVLMGKGLYAAWKPADTK